ncbi:MAG: SRPBCC domain-containing protein [Eubacteriales bacterium]|jgi:uncharacterized protein YndB with AHSA1/START domain|nr:SRPBCC domain-containing protein [Eubacteriales bacterium]MDD4105663.1 SRPBCC domain-containing protein [Eubacteriales bacterium]
MSIGGKIKISALIEAPIDLIWQYYTDPEHIKKWNSPTPDWHTPLAENDLRVGGRFLYRMEAKDGSYGYDFEGVYTLINEREAIDYTIPDGRKVHIAFNEGLGVVDVRIAFDADDDHPVKAQRDGWQAILKSFRQYCENMAKKTRTI